MWFCLSVTYSLLGFSVTSVVKSILFSFGCSFVSQISFLQPSQCVLSCRGMSEFINMNYIILWSYIRCKAGIVVLVFVNTSKRSAVFFAASPSWDLEFTAQTGSRTRGARHKLEFVCAQWYASLLPPQPCFYLLISFSSLVVCEWERFSILICGRLFPQKTATNVGDEEWGIMCPNTSLIWWGDFFARWMKPDLTPLFAQRNVYSSCTSLHFTAVGSRSGSAAPIASLLMDLCIGFSSAGVLMHMMCSYMSQWAVGNNTTRRF